MRNVMFLALICLSLFATINSDVTRKRLPGEIIPESAQQSKTLYDDEATYAAAHAIDLDIGTASNSVANSDNESWLKLKLSQTYCVDKVVEFLSDGTSTQHTWTCDKSGCSDCVGTFCGQQVVTVTSEKTAANNLPPESNCKYGDTVTLTDNTAQRILVYEIAVIGRWCTKGQYLDQKTGGCQDCLKNQWSAGGNVDKCTPCPNGHDKQVAAGAGGSETDCTWEPCTKGKYLNQNTGCQDCPKNQWSAGGKFVKCTPCPNGKEVAAGAGGSETDCNAPEKDDDKTKLSFANSLKINAALLVVLTAAFLI